MEVYEQEESKEGNTVLEGWDLQEKQGGSKEDSFTIGKCLEH